MKRPIAYGIDFGTTNSSIAVAWDNGEVEVISIDTAAAVPTCLPSIVYLDRQGVALAGTGGLARYAITGANRTWCSRCPLVTFEDGIGFSDCHQYRQDGTCHDARLIAGVKNEFADDEFTFTHSWATDFDLPSFAAVIVERLVAAAQKLSSQPVRRFVMGHPVAFVGAEGPDFARRQQTAEQRLRETARRFGAEEIELFPEPAAAVLGADFTDGNAVMVDFGGGTFDVAVMQVRGSEANITALQGAAVGGQDFDREIFKAFVAPQLGLDSTLSPHTTLFYPAAFLLNLSHLNGLKFLLADPNTLFTLKALRAAGMDTGPVEELLYGGQGYNLYRAIESAKIVLSDRETADIRFQRGELNVSVRLHRSDFERLVDPHLDTALHAVQTALSKAGITPTDVDVVYRTGGSSLIPRFVERLQNMLPRADVRQRPAFITVAYGLGLVAQEVWGHARP